MIASEKGHENLSDYNQILFRQRIEVNKKQIFSGKKIKNSGNGNYDYAHSCFGEDF